MKDIYRLGQGGYVEANEPEPTLVSSDNWKHRSINMRCATCMWFVYKEVIDKPVHLGRCRRHAPTMKGFPAVFGSDWCGDHKLDETKI